MASTTSTTVTATPIFITTATLNSLLSHHTLIHHLHHSLPTISATTPPRQSHTLSPNSSLLLMPSWSTSPSLPFLGVKLVTHFPLNSTLNNLPGVQAIYTLFSSLTGQPLASMDGTLLTLFRTSSISALASKLLSRPNSKILAMIGAGALAPHLIKAHLAARPSLQKVIIWNRNVEKAEILAEKMKAEAEDGDVEFESNGCLEEVVKIADIVSCATNSESPLVKGEWLKKGAHLDLVGSFKSSMRECDDEAIRRGRVVVDCEAAAEEAGELVGALERGVIVKGDIVANLVELIEGKKAGRKTEEDITVFKSVGSAVVDLLTAKLVYETYVKDNQFVKI